MNMANSNWCKTIFLFVAYAFKLKYKLWIKLKTVHYLTSLIKHLPLTFLFPCVKANLP